MKRVVAIIQARTGSTRFPGKVLQPILGIQVLRLVYDRVRRAHSINKVIVATSDLPGDIAIVELCASFNIPVFIGSETDVLDRFYRAAEQEKAETVVRITADCPCIDPALIDRAVEHYFAEDCDHCSIAAGAGVPNGLKRFPDGFDVEVFSFAALRKAWQGGASKFEREHVTPFIWQHPNDFRLRVLESDQDLSEIHLTLDYPKDLEIIRNIYEVLGQPDPCAFGLGEIQELYTLRPEIFNGNQDGSPL